MLIYATRKHYSFFFSEPFNTNEKERVFMVTLKIKERKCKQIEIN